MGYENAPATAMLATHCAVCRRPLLDAVSVEAGIGPICRDKHGYDAEVGILDEETRRAANKIIHRIALDVTAPGVAADLAALRLMGCTKTAERIEYRGKDAPPKKPVVIQRSLNGKGYAVTTPYMPSSLDGWRKIPGRRWVPETKENFVPTAQRDALWTLLRTHFAGYPLVANGTLENDKVASLLVEIPAMEAA